MAANEPNPEETLHWEIRMERGNGLETELNHCAFERWTIYEMIWTVYAILQALVTTRTTSGDKTGI